MLVIILFLSLAFSHSYNPKNGVYYSDHLSRGEGEREREEREGEEGGREATIAVSQHTPPAATGCLLYCSITIHTIPRCAVEGILREGVGTATSVGGCCIDCCWNQLQPARQQTGERIPVTYSKRS